MILSNVEMHRALDEGRLNIDPEPSPRVPTLKNKHCPYDTHSVDLRLGDEISVLRSGPYAYDHTQPGSLSDHIANNSENIRLTSHSTFKLAQNVFALGATLERIELPILKDAETCLAARIEGKSSRARAGLLIHFTAPTVHPGFKGRLVLEMINLGPSPIILTSGMYIAQLIVEEVKGCPNEAPSRFQGQMSSQGK